MQAAGAVQGEFRDSDLKTSIEGLAQGPALPPWFLLQVQLEWLRADPSLGTWECGNVGTRPLPKARPFLITPPTR